MQLPPLFSLLAKGGELFEGYDLHRYRRCVRLHYRSLWRLGCRIDGFADLHGCGLRNRMHGSIGLPQQSQDRLRVLSLCVRTEGALQKRHDVAFCVGCCPTGPHDGKQLFSGCNLPGLLHQRATFHRGKSWPCRRTAAHARHQGAGAIAAT